MNDHTCDRKRSFNINQCVRSRRIPSDFRCATTATVKDIVREKSIGSLILNDKRYSTSQLKR